MKLITRSVLEGEIVMAMRLLGAKSLKDITPDMVECLHEVWK
jgi:isopentenyl diphosphate isomerase/L-lactate dehydrogenase-like FMN-dependent dehydrogenase